MSSYTIDWSDVIKKEARGSNDEDLGEVHESRGKLCFSTERADQQIQILHSKGYGRKLYGDVLRFNISERSKIKVFGRLPHHQQERMKVCSGTNKKSRRNCSSYNRRDIRCIYSRIYYRCYNYKGTCYRNKNC